MKPTIAASLLVFSLAACGGPSEEDILTPDKVRASESAPELPDIQLSENPEPPPAPPAPEQPELNELENMVEADELAPVAEVIPAALHGRWGMDQEDCHSGDVDGNGLLVSTETLMAADSIGRLEQVIAAEPERFVGLFDYGGSQLEEQLVLTGSSNTLIRISGGQRLVYRRC